METRSKIRGHFHGYRPGIVFELSDGTNWQQVRGPLIPTQLYRPGVVIRHTEEGHYLEVDGMGKAVRVREVNSRWKSSLPTLIYRWNGDYYGFIYRDGFFDKEGHYLGWVDAEDRVWRAVGTYWGVVFMDMQIVRYTGQDEPLPLKPRKPIAPPAERPPGGIKAPRSEHEDKVDVLSD